MMRHTDTSGPAGGVFSFLRKSSYHREFHMHKSHHCSSGLIHKRVSRRFRRYADFHGLLAD